MSEPTKTPKGGDPGTSKPRKGRRPQASDLRAAKDELYRKHILAVAESVFAEQGFTSTKMQDIARSAGISLGTLYQSYASKRELHRNVLIARDTEMFEAVMQKGQAVLQQPESIERLLWLQRTHLEFMLEHPDYLRMQLHEGYAWYHDAAWPSSEEQQLWMRGLDVIEQVFDWGSRHGLFVPGTPRDDARLLLVMQQTRLANWVLDEMREAHETVIGRVLADFVRQFCRPDVAAGMLSEDGAALSQQAQERLAAIDQKLGA